jgi:hypothetical protein
VDRLELVGHFALLGVQSVAEGNSVPGHDTAPPAGLGIGLRRAFHQAQASVGDHQFDAHGATLLEIREEYDVLLGAPNTATDDVLQVILGPLVVDPDDVGQTFRAISYYDSPCPLERLISQNQPNLFRGHQLLTENVKDFFHHQLEIYGFGIKRSAHQLSGLKKRHLANEISSTGPSDGS